jgi:putative tricarboxylic transport membrane protein
VDVFGDLLNGIAGVMTPANLLLLAAGVLVGMVVGVMPGLGPSAGLAILLPLTFGLDPTGAIVMLAAVYYGAMYGGTITSVLINTPGESASLATTFDGYPMAQQGRAGPALVLAAVASFVAGTVGAILISLTAPAVASMASNFGPPELFLVVVAGLLTLVVIIGKNRLLGAVSALAGFAMATVGIDVTTGTQRYTFGSPELIEGVDFVPVAIGLFGVGEILWSLYNGAHREDLAYVHVSSRSRGFWPTRRDWKESRGSMTRGSLMGFFIGSIPGAGATVASLMSYSAEKAISKEPQKFGKGAVPGVVGPEAANNGASAGSMVPLLTLGIPGSSATAVLLGGFLIWGLTPGPLLMEQNPEFAWGLIGSMYLGNVMLLVINIFCVPAFASIARVPFRILGPIVILLCIIGAFAVNGSVLEVGIMLLCGVLGFFMRRYGFSPAALVIALVLGPLAEESLRQTLLISGGSFDIFVQRPASLALLLFVALLLILAFVAPLAFAAVRKRVQAGVERREQEAAGTGGSGSTGKDEQRQIDV